VNVTCEECTVTGTAVAYKTTSSVRSSYWQPAVQMGIILILVDLLSSFLRTEEPSTNCNLPYVLYTLYIWNALRVIKNILDKQEELKNEVQRAR